MIRTTSTTIPLVDLHPHPDNPRVPGKVDDLLASIAQDGLLLPLIVTKNGTGFAVVAGNRRLEALQQLVAADADSPLKTPIYELAEAVPCIKVDAATAKDVARIAAIENRHRTDMDVFETADSIVRMTKAGMKSAEIAKVLGVPAKWISQQAQLARCTPAFRTAVREERAAMDTAPMVALMPAADQDRLAKKATTNNPLRSWTLKQERTTAKASEAKALDKAKITYDRDFFTDDLVIHDAGKYHEFLVAQWLKKEKWPTEKAAHFGSAPEGLHQVWQRDEADVAYVGIGYDGLRATFYSTTKPAKRYVGGAWKPAKPEGVGFTLAHMPEKTKYLAAAAHVAMVARSSTQWASTERRRAAVALAAMVLRFSTRGGYCASDVYQELLCKGAPTHDGARLAGVFRNVVSVLANESGETFDKPWINVHDVEHAVHAARSKIEQEPSETIGRLSLWLPDALIFGDDFTALMIMSAFEPRYAQPLARAFAIPLDLYADSSCGDVMERMSSGQLRAWLETHLVPDVPKNAKKAELVAIAKNAKLPLPEFMHVPAVEARIEVGPADVIEDDQEEE